MSGPSDAYVIVLMVVSAVCWGYVVKLAAPYIKEMVRDAWNNRKQK